ncbi:MAG: phage/plasmid primase, P4 family [Candidatus Micrarchaeaceae archaeon]
MGAEIKTWKDLSPEEQKEALSSDMFFELLKQKYPGADFSEREKLLEKYTMTLKCSYCGSDVKINLLTGFDGVCPYCHRKSKGLAITPAKAAEWLAKTYRFCATRDMNETLYVYQPELGTWSDEKAKAVISEECKRIFGENYKNQDLTNTLLNLTSQVYIEPKLLNSALRQNSPELLINVENGVVIFSPEKGISFREHRPEDYFLGALPVKYDAEAPMPGKIIKFIADISDTPEFALTLLEALAYPLLPGMPIQQALVLIGSGQNGKTTFLNLLQKFYGEENVANVSLQLLSNAALKQPFALTKLYKKMLNVVDDLPSQKVVDVGLFKQLVGGSTVEAERKFGAMFSFQNSAKFYFAANQMPSVNENTLAYWRRFVFVEFSKKIERPRDMRELLGELTSERELSGLLNLLLRYIIPKLWNSTTYTFAQPPEIAAETYLRNSDSASLFVARRLVYDRASIMPKAEIYAAYKQFCAEEEIEEKNERSFWLTVKNVYPLVADIRVQEAGVRIYKVQGLRLKEENFEKIENEKAEIEKIYKEKVNHYFDSASGAYYAYSDWQKTSFKEDFDILSILLKLGKKPDTLGTLATETNGNPTGFQKYEKFKEFLNTIPQTGVFASTLPGSVEHRWNLLYPTLNKLGLSADEVDKLINEALELGDLYEPKPGVLAKPKAEDDDPYVEEVIK